MAVEAPHSRLALPSRGCCLCPTSQEDPTRVGVGRHSWLRKGGPEIGGEGAEGSLRWPKGSDGTRPIRRSYKAGASWGSGRPPVPEAGSPGCNAAGGSPGTLACSFGLQSKPPTPHPRVVDRTLLENVARRSCFDALGCYRAPPLLQPALLEGLAGPLPPWPEIFPPDFALCDP